MLRADFLTIKEMFDISNKTVALSLPHPSSAWLWEVFLGELSVPHHRCLFYIDDVTLEGRKNFPLSFSAVCLWLVN